jgi:hypothetical protein
VGPTQLSIAREVWRSGVLVLGLVLAGCEGRDPSVARSPTRMVAAPSGGTDASKSGRDVGMLVGPGISEQEVSEITSLVHSRDSGPILSVDRLPAVSNRLNRHGADIRVTTGVPRGHGSYFDLQKSDEGWSIVVEGKWVS